MGGQRAICARIISIAAVLTIGDLRAEPFHYYFFDRAQPLNLHLTQVSFRSADLHVASPGLPIPGWVISELPPEAHSEAGVRQAIDALLADPAVEFASAVFLSERGGRLIVTQDLLVEFSADVSETQARAVLSAHGAATTLSRDWAGMPGAFRVRHGSRNGWDVLAAANQLAELEEVVFAEPDMIFTGRGSLLPDDFYFSLSWGLHNKGQDSGAPDADMDAVEAWELSTGDPSVIVVVIDTGIQLDHPDLNVMPGTDTTSDGPGDGAPVNDLDNHGTAVAGCVSAHINNTLGTAGIAPHVRTAPARTFISTDEKGGWTAQSSWTVDSLAWAESIGARITTNSNAYDAPSSAIAQKYAQTRQNGMIHFASAHNDNLPVVSYPASLPTVRALAALTRTGERASYSNYGPDLDFSAPGDYIVSTDRTGPKGYVLDDYLVGDGTSFASPFAAGIAALVLSRNPGLHAATVEHILQDSCVDLGEPGYDTEYGWGFMNAYGALTLADPAMLGACCAMGQCTDSLAAIDCQQASGPEANARWFAAQSCSQVICPPSNTRCEWAAPIPAGGKLAFDNSHLTSLPSASYSCGLEDFHDGTVWFRFTAQDTSVRLNSCDSLSANSTFSVYDACNAPSALACSEDDGTCAGREGLGDICVRDLIPGHEYFVQFSAWSSADRGSYALEVQSPCPPLAPHPDPSAISKNRSFSLSVPPSPSPTAQGVQPTALRVRLMDLQNPVPPNPPQSPPQDFSDFESGATCRDPSGCVRWAGPPMTYPEELNNPAAGAFRAARLQCTPFYHDWSLEQLFFIMGAEILPSSVYEIENVSANCTGSEADCTQVSDSLRVVTGRHGDVVAPFNPPGPTQQPDGVDVASMVNKFRGLVGAPSKTIAKLQPNVPEPNANVDALDIVACVDAFRGFRYPFSGPCDCPSAVVCNAVSCMSHSACGEGLCVRTCTGGTADGVPCTNNTQCPSGACGPGFCRDACARCTP